MRGVKPGRRTRRAIGIGHHMSSADVISMPDKWEYPWFAAWDLAFHVAAARAGRSRLRRRTNGTHSPRALPAPERPDSRLRVELRRCQPARPRVGEPLQLSAEHGGAGRGRRSLSSRRIFHKLLLNFTWWLNRKDRNGSNVFEGGFLGLDNIGVFDRSSPLPTGGYLEQADGTAWMALYSPEHARDGARARAGRPGLRRSGDQVLRAFHLDRGGDERGRRRHEAMWDEEDGFFYDVLRVPDGSGPRASRCGRWWACCRCAPSRCTARGAERLPKFAERVRWFNASRPDLLREHPPARRARALAAGSCCRMLNENKLRRVLARMLDPAEFLAITAFARSRGFTSTILTSSTSAGRRTGCRTFRRNPTPACSAAIRIGAGPIWSPVNALVVRALLQMYRYLRGRLPGRVPTGIRTAHELVRSGPGNREPARCDLPADVQGSPTGLRRD